MLSRDGGCDAENAPLIDADCRCKHDCQPAGCHVRSLWGSSSQAGSLFLHQFLLHLIQPILQATVLQVSTVDCRTPFPAMSQFSHLCGGRSELAKFCSAHYPKNTETAAGLRHSNEQAKSAMTSVNAKRLVRWLGYECDGKNGEFISEMSTATLWHAFSDLAQQS